jgi:hypothetical protein
MIMRCKYLVPLLFLVCSTASVAAREPLTEQAQEKYLGYFELIFDTRLNQKERSQLLASLAKDWTGPSEQQYESARGIVNMADEIAEMSEEERVGTRAVRFAELWPLLDDNRDKLADATMLIKAYTRDHEILAQGRPPLSDEIADAKARHIQFIVREGSAGKVELPLDAVRQRLVKTYSSLAPDKQRATVHSIGEWAKIQYQWARSSEQQKQSRRNQWTAEVAEMFPELADSLPKVAASSQSRQAATAQQGNGYDPAKFAEAQRKLYIERARRQMAQDGMTSYFASRLNTINNAPGGTYSYWGVR